MFSRVLFLLGLSLNPLQAQERDVFAGVPERIVTAVRDLPPTTFKYLGENPGSFIENYAKPIVLFGRKGGLDVRGMQDFLDTEQADRRSQFLRDFLRADMNNDGSITRQELDVALRVFDDCRQTKLVLGFHNGDLNRDDVLDWGELRALAQTRVQDHAGQAREAAFRGMMAFDLDQNGLLTLAEFMQVVDAFRQKL